MKRLNWWISSVKKQIVYELFHRCFFIIRPLMFVAWFSNDVCCLQVTIGPDFKQTYNTLKTEIEIEFEATAKNKLKSRSRSKPETEIEMEIEADWKLKPRSKPRSTTEIEIEIEIDPGKRDQNGNRLRSQKNFWKSTSSPVSGTSVLDLIWGLRNVDLSKKRPQNLRIHESCHMALADGMIYWRKSMKVCFLNWKSW